MLFQWNNEGWSGVTGESLILTGVWLQHVLKCLIPLITLQKPRFLANLPLFSQLFSCKFVTFFLVNLWLLSQKCVTFFPCKYSRWLFFLSIRNFVLANLWLSYFLVNLGPFSYFISDVFFLWICDIFTSKFNTFSHKCMTLQSQSEFYGETNHRNTVIFSEEGSPHPAVYFSAFILLFKKIFLPTMALMHHHTQLSQLFLSSKAELFPLISLF